MEHPQLDFNLQKSTLHIDGIPYFMPFFPLGQLMIQTPPNKMLNFLQKVTETALVGSRLAPCCPNHMKRG